MSDYTKSTNFASKDSLSVGNPLKIVKGTEIDTEFNNIATAVATKADIANPTFTGVPSAPTASAGTSTTQVATTAFTSTAVSNAITAYDTALTISTAQIENDAVTADKIAAGAVGNAELATDAVTQGKMANNSVGTAEIIDANITASKLDGSQSGSAPIYGARAWVNFNGTGTTGANQTIRASGNVTSVYKNGTGDYTITFTTALNDSNYATTIVVSNSGTAGPIGFREWTTKSASSVRIKTATITPALVDLDEVCVVIYR